MEIPISDIRKLCVKVFVIGYPSCGESIVVCFMDGEMPLYTCVIDSFKYRCLNQTVEVLKSLDVSRIDVLCWSHPDRDHTFDISTLISAYCDSDTAILVPLGIHGKDYGLVKYNKGDRKLVERILALNELSRRSFVTTNVRPGYRMEVEDLVFSSYPDSIRAEIMALSPFSPLINHRIAKNQTITKNELSIALCITVGGHRFLLCSDVENNAIGTLHSESLYKPLLVKIPHHASATAADLLDCAKLSKTGTYACSTGYHSQGLPDAGILGRYGQACAKVHFTGGYGADKYGMVEYTFFPMSYVQLDSNNKEASDLDGSIIYDGSKMNIKCHGNATCVYPVA